MIDFMIIVAVNIVLNLLITLLTVLSPDAAAAVQILIFMILTLCYGMFFEWVWRGQTPGKRVLNLRVVDETGRGLLPVQVIVRNLLRAVDLLPFAYGVGGLTMVLTRRCQRLGDLAAGTVVVRRIKLGSPDVEELLAGKYNSFRDHPVIEARLRQRVSPEEAKVCLSALLRRNSLEPDARLDVYGELADHFRGVADFPETSTYGNDRRAVPPQYCRIAVSKTPVWKSRAQPRYRSDD